MVNVFSTYQPTTSLTYHKFNLMFACFAWTSVKQKARPSRSVKSFGVFCKLSNAYLGSIADIAGSSTTRIRSLQQQASKLLRHPTRIPRYLQLYVGDTLITPKQLVYESSLTKQEKQRVVQALDASESVSIMWDEDDAWAIEEAHKSAYFFLPHYLVVDVYKLDAHIMALNTTHQVHMLSLQATNKHPYSDAYDKSQFVVYNNLEVLEGFTNISGLCLLNVIPYNHNMFSRLLNLQSFSIKNTTRRKLGLYSTQLIDVLAGLPRLETFTLDGFPDFSSDLVNLTNLKRVFVTNSNFSVYQLFSLSSTNLLASLQTVAIKDCTHMNKSLPSEIGLLTVCRDLCLSQCRLEGKIPPELGVAQSLTKLYLAVNQLTGSIPTELGLLTNLTILELQFNRLCGNIPCCLFDLNRLEHLEHLDLSNNKLTGAIPPTTGLASLTSLDLSQNKLSGTIPATLSNLANLTTLDVSFNKLTGQVPSELARLYKLWSFHAYSNNLSPNLPQELLKWVTTSYSRDRKVFLGDNPEYDSDNGW